MSYIEGRRRGHCRGGLVQLTGGLGVRIEGLWTVQSATLQRQGVPTYSHCK